MARLDWRAWGTRILCRQLLMISLSEPRTERSRNIWIDRQAPSLEQPLRYVTSVPIVLTPASQLFRGRVAILGQAKPAGLQLKFRGTGGRNRHRFSAAPARIAWLTCHLLFPGSCVGPSSSDGRDSSRTLIDKLSAGRNTRVKGGCLEFGAVA